MTQQQPDDEARPEPRQQALAGAGHGAYPAAGAAHAEDDPCAAAVERLWSYVDHELDTSEAAELREHLEECTPCLEEYGIDVVLKTVVRRGCQESAPDTLRLRIHQTLLHVSTDPQV